MFAFNNFQALKALQTHSETFLEAPNLTSSSTSLTNPPLPPSQFYVPNFHQTNLPHHRKTQIHIFDMEKVLEIVEKPI
jgi:hypothetical protein